MLLFFNHSKVGLKYSCKLPQYYIIIFAKFFHNEVGKSIFLARQLFLKDNERKRILGKILLKLSVRNVILSLFLFCVIKFTGVTFGRGSYDDLLILLGILFWNSIIVDRAFLFHWHLRLWKHSKRIVDIYDTNGNFFIGKHFACSFYENEHEICKNLG